MPFSEDEESSEIFTRFGQYKTLVKAESVAFSIDRYSDIVDTRNHLRRAPQRLAFEFVVTPVVLLTFLVTIVNFSAYP